MRKTPSTLSPVEVSQHRLPMKAIALNSEDWVIVAVQTYTFLIFHWIILCRWDPSEEFWTSSERISKRVHAYVLSPFFHNHSHSQDLERMCLPYTSSSSRIITDNSGISKGVGFMRFESRETAGRVIKSLHLKDVDGSSSPLQARFADSEAQKRLRGSNRSTSSRSSSEKTSGLNSRASSDQEFRRFSHPPASREDRYRPEEMIRSRSPQDPRYTILQRRDEQDSFSSNQNRRSTGSPSGFLHRAVRGQSFEWVSNASQGSTDLQKSRNIPIISKYFLFPRI